MTDYTWPDDLVPSGSSFKLQPHTGGSQSPFSRVGKYYGLSAPLWTCSLSFKAARGARWGTGKHVIASRLDAIVTRLKGRLNRIQLWDFDFPDPRSGLATAKGNLFAARGATEMTITGMTPGLKVMTGDYLGGDGRPHMILDDVAVDGSGHATVSFEPPLAADVQANAAIFRQVTGTFRLTGDDAGDNFNEVYDLINYSLQFVEDPINVLPVPLYGLTGLWVVSDFVSTPTPSIPNRVTDARLSPNIYRFSRRFFANDDLWHKVSATAVDAGLAGPDAVTDASTLNGTGNWRLAPYWLNPTIPAGDYVIACSVKRNAGSDQQFAFTKDAGSTRSGVQTATAAWQRFSYAFTLSSTGTADSIGLCSKDGTTAANLQIRDLELFAGSADAGPVGPDSHLYIGHLPGRLEGSYAGGVLTPPVGFIQFPRLLTLTPFTAQFCVEVTTSGRNTVLADAAAVDNFPLASEGLNGPMTLASGTSIANRQAGATDWTYQQADLFDLIGQGIHVFTYRYDGAALELWVDDVRMFRDEESYSRSARDFFFGTGLLAAGIGNNNFSGFLGLWTRALSDAEIRQCFAVQKTVATGLAIAGDTADRVYVAEGDSISGGNGELCYPFQYGAHDSPVVLGTVWSVTGSKLTDLVARAARVDAIIPPNPNGRKFLLSVLIGANDLFNYPGATDTIAANAYAAALAAYCDARRAAGFKVVVCTILPQTDSVHNTRRAIVNSAITGSWAGVHCDGIADFAGNATMGPNAAASNTTYYSDGKHPTAAGHLILETVIRPVLNGL